MKWIYNLLITLICISVSGLKVIGQGVQITEYGSIRLLVDQYTRLNKEEPYTQGWRIQIITTDDRRRMERAINQFRALYPDMQYDWIHRSPYYQVKVGAFRDRLDYQKFLLEVKENFSSAIPIIDRIRKEELLRD